MKPRKSPTGGWALGTTLACMIALSVLLFAAVSAGVSHLQMVNKVSNAQHAKNLAEAALAKAITQLATSNYTFGKNGSDRLEITNPELEGSSGIVTFDDEPGFADAHSTFNLDNDDVKPGVRGRQVPGRSVHLVARGRVGNSESWMECIYYRPPFPDGLAASGPVWVRSLYLAAVTKGEAYSGGNPSQIPVEDSRPANLFTNATGPEAAQIQEGCHITGSAGAMGQVSVDPSSQILGEVLPGSERREIPEMDIKARIEALRPNAVDVVTTGGSLELDPDWFAQAPSGLSIGGDLNLNGSVLLVQGDLRVSGSIQGTGVILVDGAVEITDGRSQLTSADQVAIACSGDFTLRAEAPEGNYFQGLVYCEGDFEAKHITVVGATVVNGKNGAQGSAKLDNVRFVQTPGSVEMELSRVLGATVSQHSWAASLTLKPKPDGKPGEFLCHARAYATDRRFCNANHNHDAPGACPIKDIPAAWRTTSENGNHLFASWNSETGVRTELHGDKNKVQTVQRTPYPEGIPVTMTSDRALILIDGNDQLTALGQELYDLFYDTESKYGNPANPDYLRGLLRDRFAKSFQNSTYQVTFNLNTLLGESLGSSRVLVWRPFQ